MDWKVAFTANLNYNNDKKCEMVPLVFRSKFLGSRLLKTCLSAFVTAYICYFLNWPPLFAVITSIVSIENTSVDSLKKGLIRFPASAIGAGAAMLFDALLGKSPISYAGAASITLIACYRLKLYDGLVVAVLTAVAMISVTSHYYLDSFFIRLGTTFTGIAVASLINYFILPPNYKTTIASSTDTAFGQIGALIRQYFSNDLPSKAKLEQGYITLQRKLDHILLLVQNQRSEWLHHKHHLENIQSLKTYQNELRQLQKAMYHLGNLLYTDHYTTAFAQEDYVKIARLGKAVAERYREKQFDVHGYYYTTLREVTCLFNLLKDERHDSNDTTSYHLPLKITLLYELLSLQDVLEELRDMKKASDVN
ncbi:uncharacterized membrane protein YgaE (UPF0421/DUF939 family) [Scopulibacillus darangshiensis]|uniref:Uncharacterized membrane protein YgaE (UPF0421/DUF939 family) n=1 Tax=Scopulibacillus darangshiensis TaxID=442528 RepID=A0A4R2P2V5_9BACL|nr:aromatic acid exporter family protein [Scopulibacillus darangshiensis]TCP28907.1 uncharacterized membrane protein YgaE (UPF0421/DUF939 family) [Scopulibacillus darangshiensis]